MQKTLLIITCLFFSQTAYAWGQNGHRIIGKIAELHLSDQAQERITQILGHTNLAKGSTWPDFMRSSKDKFWRTASPLHYVTIPKGKEYQDITAPKQGDSTTALIMFSDIIKSKDTTLEEKKRALKFIVHIIGDLHQPLHAGDGTDRGGNDFKVTFFNQETNLHSVWDTKLIEHRNLSYTEYADFLLVEISKDNVKKWSVTDPVIWINESIKIRDRIYPKNTNLWYEYIFETRKDLNSRLKMGGIRLAAYLNELFT